MRFANPMEVRRFAGRSSLLLERPSIGIGRDAASGQNQNTFDQSPHCADSAGEKGYEDLSNAHSGVAEIESVDAESAEKNPEQACHELGPSRIISLRDRWNIQAGVQVRKFR